MDNSYTREELEQMQHSRVNDLDKNFIGNAVVKKYKDDLIFCSSFLKEDVDYFRNEFKKIKQTTDNNFLWFTLKNCIEEKITADKESNLIEPYLYALKLEDNCFASELSGGVPNLGKLEAYVKAANCIYESANKQIFFKVVKHTLVNWEWYQPLLAVIALCGEYPQFQDDEVNEILRMHMLYRKKYAKTTFATLLNRPSQRNYEEILRFLASGKNKDVITGTEIEADNSMITMFFDAMKARQDEEIFAYIQDIYMHTYRGNVVNRKARNRLEHFFITADPDDNWKSMFRSYGNADEKERASILQKVRKDYQPGKRESGSTLVDVQDPDLFDVITDKLSYAHDRDLFWGLLNIGKSRYSKAKEYIKNGYNTMQEGNKSYFPYMLASYLSNGIPDLQELCSYYFLNDYLPNETLYAAMFKHVISYKKVTQEFQNCLDNVIMQCKEDQNQSERLLIRAKEMFGAGIPIENSYPVKAMDSFLKDMLEKGFSENNMKILSCILAILDKMTIDTTKGRYEDMLLMFVKKMDENSTQLKQARNILRRVHGR